MKKLTIIIPVYNAEKTIIEALESIRNNKHYEKYQDNIQVIIVDDGSKDQSVNLIKRYIEKKENFLLIEKENSGAANTRNVGLDKVKEGYIAFLDSDDTYTENFLDKVFFNLSEQVIYIYNITYVDENNSQLLLNLKEDIHREVDKEFIIKYLQNGDFIAPSVVNKIYNADIINQHNIRFMPDLKYGEDLFFNLQYLQYVQNAKLDNEALYKYNANQSSTMHTIKLEDKKYFDYLLNQLEQYIEKNEISQKYIYLMYFKYMVLIINAILKTKESFWLKWKQVNTVLNEEKMIQNIAYIDSKELNIKRKIIYWLYKLKFYVRRKKDGR